MPVWPLLLVLLGAVPALLLTWLVMDTHCEQKAMRYAISERAALERRLQHSYELYMLYPVTKDLVKGSCGPLPLLSMNSQDRRLLPSRGYSGTNRRSPS